MIGTTLSHDKVVEKLGEGGMGVVYEARDLRLDRFVALEVLPPGNKLDPDRMRRFVQEARAASALHHPGIVTVFGIDEAAGVPFIAMEFVDGRTLAEVIGRKGLQVGEAVRLKRQVAEALAAAVLLLVAGTWLGRRVAGERREAAPPVPLTSYTGNCVHLALSPDGRFTASSWTGERQDDVATST